MIHTSQNNIFKSPRVAPSERGSTRHFENVFCFVCTRGFSLVEVLVYIAVFAVSLSLIVGTALALARSYRGVSGTAAVERSAVAVLERLTRTARESVSVGAVGEALVLNTTSGGAVEFFVQNGALRFKESGVDKGALTENAVVVSSFVAQKIATGRSEAVKIILTINNKNFYATTVVRNSY